jgi:hypothetical protein
MAGEEGDEAHVFVGVLLSSKAEVRGRLKR